MRSSALYAYKNEAKKKKEKYYRRIPLHEVEDARNPVRHLELGASEARMRIEKMVILMTHTLHEVEDALNPVRYLELGASEACMRTKKRRR